MASSELEALAIAQRIGYPVLVRPSFVLGGRGMEIVYDDQALAGFISRATDITPDHPVLVDRFLDSAIELDVDALYDGEELFLGGIMEHIEEAGIHSGDSACVLPAMTISNPQRVAIREATLKIARGVDVRGLINIQFAMAENVLYVLEANPRASRTVPFVSKATGVPLAKAAARISLGSSIASLRAEGLLPASGDAIAKGISVKEAVLPWNRFRRVDGRGVDAVLGPEMRSTGEVMGIANSFGEAYAKSQISSFGPLPKSGTVFISLADKDKNSGINPAKELVKLGFRILATDGTASFLNQHGVNAIVVRKNSQGTGPMGEKTIVELLNGGDIDLVINTPVGRGTRADGWAIRTASVQRSIPIITTTAGFSAAVQGIKALQSGVLNVSPIQDWLKQ
jgi:carbamoyl-phosphate synthase large subunit